MRKREATWGLPGAAVHRHILDRMNAINDYFNKKKAARYALDIKICLIEEYTVGNTR